MPLSLSGTTGIVSGNIAVGGVQATNIGSDQVTTAKILDGNITPAKLTGGQTGSAPIYGARAWFYGETGGSIYASSNIASITNGGTGVGTVTFTTPMPTADYSIVFGSVSNVRLQPILYTKTANDFIVYIGGLYYVNGAAWYPSNMPFGAAIFV
jgi:hypothetical protein